MPKDYDAARDLLDRRLGEKENAVRDATRTDTLMSAVYNAAVQVIMDLLAADEAEPVRRLLAPGDARDRVTRASRLLVHSAGGEIVVPFSMADRVDDLELDQIDEPQRSRVIYRTRDVKGAAGQVVDVNTVSVGGRRMGKTHRLAHMTAAALKKGDTVIDGNTGHEIVGVPGYDDGRQIDSKVVDQ